jgi:glutathione S-transferase
MPFCSTWRTRLGVSCRPRAESARALLSGREYFLGAEYSIVDIAFYAWYFASLAAGFEIERRANLQRWFERVSARPAVARGVTIPKQLPELPPRKRA